MPMSLLLEDIIVIFALNNIFSLSTYYNMSSQSVIQIKIVHTSDVHGNFFMWDYVNERPVRGSLARVYAYILSLRKQYGERLIMMDGGDMLQGTPAIYYNNVNPVGNKNLAAEVMNYMGYDVATIGNHDLETGHQVYDKWIADCDFPIVCANIIDKTSGDCYLPPYTVIERSGIRIAIMGMTTPAVPNWLSPDLWEGLYFEDMVSSATRWAKEIKEKERPDVLVGLFHSGKQGGIVNSDYVENAAFDVARNVSGFDVICYGHDHARNCEKVVAPDGKEVMCCAPSNMANVICEVDLEILIQDGKKTLKQVEGKITDLSFYKSDNTSYFHKYFKRHLRNTEYYVKQKIGEFTHTVTSEDAYFGSSAFIDLIHSTQLEVTGAQISFAAPLSFSAQIKGGDVCVRDMFKLYSHENSLYVMKFTGAEIKGILEMSYSLWVRQMKSPDEHIMLLDYVLEGGKRMGFLNLAYNFDSAAGIRYEVDVTKPIGEKVNIISMADGTPFNPDEYYTVTSNSYRGNGGGELFTKGTGLSHEELLKRLVWSTEKDLRHYLIEYIKGRGVVDAQPLNHWRFVPDDWVVPACRRDRELLFGYRHKAD